MIKEGFAGRLLGSLALAALATSQVQCSTPEPAREWSRLDTRQVRELQRIAIVAGQPDPAGAQAVLPMLEALHGQFTGSFEVLTTRDVMRRRQTPYIDLPDGSSRVPPRMGAALASELEVDGLLVIWPRLSGSATGEAIASAIYSLPSGQLLGRFFTGRRGLSGGVGRSRYSLRDNALSMALEMKTALDRSIAATEGSWR